MNFGEMKNWDAYGIKQTMVSNGTNILRTEGYFAVVKTDYIELQKYPAPSSGAILQSVKNDGFVLPNTYHKIESSCIHKEDGAHILFKVDGKTVLDYVDTDNPNLKVGYFSKQANSAANSGVFIKSDK